MRNAWYVVAESHELKMSKPLARRLQGEELVLFRTPQGQAVALPDRCPHRNVRLSRGKIHKGHLQCPYHGWEFDAQGRCVYIPSLDTHQRIPAAAHLNPLPLIEQQDLIWVWSGDRLPAPEETPFVFPHWQEPGWGWGRLQATIPNSVANVIENFIDCCHTGYIHGGLFRTAANHQARIQVQTCNQGVVIDIDEDTDYSSLLSRLLVKGKVIHQDSFILPSIVQMAYSFAQDRQIIGWQICVPLEAMKTQIYVHVTWKMGVLNPFIRLVYPWIGRLILYQDIKILADQGEVIQRFEEQFTSVPADTANLWIRAYRSRVEKGQKPSKQRKKQVHFRL